MAEIALVRSTRAHRIADPADESARWRAGEPAVVQEDGHAWSPRERAAFIILRIPGVPARRLRRYLQEDTIADPLSGRVTGRRRRRLWRVLLDELPPAARAAIRDTGVVTASWDQVRGHWQNQLTTARAEALDP